MPVWGRAGVGAFLTGVNPTQLHFPGMTKTQTVRIVGFALIVLGAALLLAARRWQRRTRDRYLPELIHRPEEPDLRDRIRGAQILREQAHPEFFDHPTDLPDGVLRPPVRWQ